MNWFYCMDDEAVGPVSEAELQRLVSDGSLPADVSVCPEGSEDWLMFSQVLEPRTSRLQSAGEYHPPGEQPALEKLRAGASEAWHIAASSPATKGAMAWLQRRWDDLRRHAQSPAFASQEDPSATTRIGLLLRRFGAFVVDGTIALLLGAILATLTNDFHEWLLFTTLACLALNIFVMEGLTASRTLGHRVCGLGTQRVGGGRASRLQAGLRAIGITVLPYLILMALTVAALLIIPGTDKAPDLLLMLGFVVLVALTATAQFGISLFLPDNRALHDLVSGTVVVRESTTDSRQALDAAPGDDPQARPQTEPHPVNEVTAARSRLPVKAGTLAAISLVVGVCLAAGMVFNTLRKQLRSGPLAVLAGGSEETHPVFRSRSTDKADIQGLHGGMSVAEAGRVLGSNALEPAVSDGNYSEPWRSYLPGFEAYQYTPDESFPIEHLLRIRLVFLNDRLQSVCYIFKRNPCTVWVERGKDPYLTTPSLHRNRLYDRDKLISDIRRAISGEFELVDQELSPDYSSGRAVPEGGYYSLEYSDSLTDSVYPIFFAASSEIFVRFYGAVENKSDIVADLRVFTSRPAQIRGDRDTREQFFLQFSFKNTYPESLALGLEHETEDADMAWYQSERGRKQASEEAAERKRVEEERIRNLRDGF